MEIEVRHWQSEDSVTPPGGFVFDVRGIPDIDCAMRVGKKAILNSPKGVLLTDPKDRRTASEWKSLDNGHWRLMRHNGKMCEVFELMLGGISLQLSGFASYQDGERVADAIQRDMGG